MSGAVFLSAPFSLLGRTGVGPIGDFSSAIFSIDWGWGSVIGFFSVPFSLLGRRVYSRFFSAVS